MHNHAKKTSDLVAFSFGRTRSDDLAQPFLFECSLSALGMNFFLKTKNVTVALEGFLLVNYFLGGLAPSRSLLRHTSPAFCETAPLDPLHLKGLRLADSLRQYEDHGIWPRYKIFVIGRLMEIGMIGICGELLPGILQLRTYDITSGTRAWARRKVFKMNRHAY